MSCRFLLLLALQVLRGTWLACLGVPSGTVAQCLFREGSCGAFLRLRSLHSFDLVRGCLLLLQLLLSSGLQLLLLLLHGFQLRLMLLLLLAVCLGLLLLLLPLRLQLSLVLLLGLPLGLLLLLPIRLGSLLSSLLCSLLCPLLAPLSSLSSCVLPAIFGALFHSLGFAFAGRLQLLNCLQLLGDVCQALYTCAEHSQWGFASQQLLHHLGSVWLPAQSLCQCTSMIRHRYVSVSLCGVRYISKLVPKSHTSASDA